MSDALADPAFHIRLANGDFHPVDDDTLISAALAALNARIQRTGKIESSTDAKAYFALHLGHHDHEVFAILFMDAQMRIIAFREMFHGTISEAAVYPREIVRHALLLNAACIQIGHVHPSGLPEPSRADEHLTKIIVEAMKLIDVRVLDHFVVGAGSAISFAERGLL